MLKTVFCRNKKNHCQEGYPETIFDITWMGRPDPIYDEDTWGVTLWIDNRSVDQVHGWASMTAADVQCTV